MTTLSALAVLADDSGGEAKKAGPIALLVIMLLVIACFFLFRSMSKHLRRVRDEFPTGKPPAQSAKEPNEPNEPPPDQPGASIPKANGTPKANGAPT